MCDHVTPRSRQSPYCSPGFRVTRLSDEIAEEAVELTNIGAPIMLVTASHGDQVDSLMVTADSREILCELQLPGLKPILCSIAAFGRTLEFAAGDQDTLVLELPVKQPNDKRGCQADARAGDAMLLVRRGSCMFEDKAVFASNAGWFEQSLSLW